MGNYWIDRAALKAEYERKYDAQVSKIREVEHRVEESRVEHEKILEEGFQEAYEAIQVDLYYQFDKRCKEFQDFIVQKVDKFLDEEWKKIVEAGNQELTEKFAAWRAALSACEMVDLAVGEAPQADVKALEARIVRLSVENQKLRELFLLQVGEKNERDS